MINWAKYEKQNVEAVDMCAAVIFAHRAKYIPIKAIHLRPKMYSEFKSWAQKNLGRDLESHEKLEFDSVHIELGTSRQASQLLIELWEKNFNINAQMQLISKNNTH